MGNTTIQLSDKTADVLHDLKRRGDTYEDVILRLLERGGVDVEGRAVVAGVEDLDLPGSGQRLEKRQEAVSAVHGLLEEKGKVGKDELLDMAVTHAGDTYDSPNSLWKNCVGPALRDLEDVEPEGNTGEWLYVG